MKRKNLGNYEHEEIKLIAQLAEGESVQECIESLRGEIESGFGSEGLESVKTQSDFVEKSKTEDAPKAKNKKVVASIDVSKEEEEEDDTKSVIKEKTTESGKKKLEVDTKKKKASKHTPYDRKNAVHKKLIGEILDEEFPKWRKNLTSEAAEASKELEGEEFLDADGSVIESFRKSLIEKMGG